MRLPTPSHLSLIGHGCPQHRLIPHSLIQPSEVELGLRGDGGVEEHDVTPASLVSLLRLKRSLVPIKARDRCQHWLAGFEMFLSDSFVMQQKDVRYAGTIAIRSGKATRLDPRSSKVLRRSSLTLATTSYGANFAAGLQCFKAQA